MQRGRSLAIAALGASRGLARRAAALAALVVVLSSALLSGQSYLFCLMMERPVEACCCAPEPAPEGVSDPAEHPEVRSGCCESRGGAELAKGRVAATASEVPPATLSTIARLPALAVIPRAQTSSRVGRAVPLRSSQIRAGPWAASDTCVRLQIFRC